MLISIIMLTYNRETFVKRSIESVLTQTFTSFEFIIVDNGSTDSSGVIADQYATSDNRIKVIHRKRGNIGSGRNVGLDAATGDYIAFVDDDDWCEPDFIEFLYHLAIENDAEVSICGATDKQFDKKLIMSSEEALIELMWRKYYNMAFPTKMFKKELKKLIRFPEKDVFDDISQMYRLLAGARRIAYYGIPKYTFYRHDGNNSAWTTNHNLLTPKTLDEYLYTYHERTQWLCERFPKSKEAWQYFEWSFMISMVEKINRLKLKNCERQLQAILQELYASKEAFLHCKYIINFEKKWMNQYIK